MGFKRKAISLKTEACYYFLPGRVGVLRVAAHQSKAKWNGLDLVVSRLTFTGRDHTGAVCVVCTLEAIDTMLYIAIGKYVANSEPSVPKARTVARFPAHSEADNP